MSDSKRGILYLVWGNKGEELLQRSIQSVRKYYPDIPIHVERSDGQGGLMQKSRMGSLTPFESTLYLDADTVVMDNLDYGFEKGEQFGIACVICECPWLRRYGPEQGDRTEYNTGVIFFSSLAKEVFSTWQRIAPTTPSQSHWLNPAGQLRGLNYDDQSSFAQAILATQWNPYVLPLNWNFRPSFYSRFFAPIKIWHDYHEPPPNLIALNDLCSSGKRPISLVERTPGGQANTPGGG